VSMQGKGPLTTISDMDPTIDAVKSLRFDSPQQAAFLNLWRTYDCLKAFEDELFAEFELSAQQYNALRLLRSVHPNSMRTLTLAGRLISRSPDITRMLDRLEKQSWIVRERRAENRRVVEVAITDAGIELLKRLDPKVQSMHEKQLGHLDATKLSQLADLLKSARRPHEDRTRDWLHASH
jgi:DNA-binding MarR family transcriptional regulator